MKQSNHVGTSFVARCKALIRARYGSVNAFCKYAESKDSPITRWQIINTLNSDNPRISQMYYLSHLLEADLQDLLFSESLSIKGPALEY